MGRGITDKGIEDNTRQQSQPREVSMKKHQANLQYQLEALGFFSRQMVTALMGL